MNVEEARDFGFDPVPKSLSRWKWESEMYKYFETIFGGIPHSVGIDEVCSRHTTQLNPKVNGPWCNSDGCTNVAAP